MSYAAIIAKEFNVREDYVQNIIALLDEGNTIPFIARYRKEQHGAMDDQLIRQIAEKLEYLRNLDARREEVRKLIEAQDNLTEEISAALDKAATLMDLMLYLPTGLSFTFLPERWRACVQMVYSMVLTRLTESYDPTQPMPELTGKDTVRQCGVSDWLLTLTDDPVTPSVDLLMSLPDEHLARCSAAVWPGVCAELREFVLTALHDAL